MSHRPSLRNTLTRLRQRGSILITTAGVLLAGVGILAGAEMGYLFYVKREMQKATDLAALAGAHHIVSTGCSAAGATATSSATQNLASLGFSTSVSLDCGLWDPVQVSGAQHFSAGVSPSNALRVTVTGTAPSLFAVLSNKPVSTSAIARSGEPFAAFSIGSKLVDLPPGQSVLGNVLKGLGLDLTGTSLVGYDGLAQIKVTPGGLLAALGIPVDADVGIGEFNDFLAGRQVSLGQLLDATAVAAGQNQLLASNVTLLNAVAAKIGSSSLNLNLGTTVAGARGVFARVVAPDGSTGKALSTEVSALDILSTGIGVATQKRAFTVNNNLNLLGLATVKTEISIIEPPAIGIGGVGATAYNAQVRTFTQLKTQESLMGSLMNKWVNVDLPIVVDVTNAKGTLTAMCTPELKQDGQDRAEITVEGAVLSGCVGKLVPPEVYTMPNACSPSTNYLADQELIDLMSLVVVNDSFYLDVLPANGVVELKVGETKRVGNELQIGTTVAGIVDQIDDFLFGVIPGGNPHNNDLQELTNQLWNDSGTAVCTANTVTCRTNRLNWVKTRIETTTTTSGLLSGVLSGLGDIVNALTGLLVHNGCTTSGSGLLGLGPAGEGFCRDMIQSALNTHSSASGGGTVSNALGVLVGIIRPLLDAVGSQILTPILQNIVGADVHANDVHLMSLTCGGPPALVY